jgi:hypothetical protein
MTTLLGLKRSATAATTWRGHKMEPWTATGSKTRAYRSCRLCGAWVGVNVSPPPNGIEIGGSAVALNCPRVKP